MTAKPMRIGPQPDALLGALAALLSNQTQHAITQAGTRANDPLATRGLKRCGAAESPGALPPPLEVSRYEQLSPVELQRKKWREEHRRRREKRRQEVLIPRRKEMHARLRAGDREAARWWGHYEMGCIANRRFKARGWPNLVAARAVLAERRALRKRRAEAEKWGNSL